MMHLSQQELLDDLYQLGTLLSETHPDPYTNCGGPIAFRRHVRQIAEAVPEQGMDTQQFLLLLRPLVASLHDGHTGLYEPSQEEAPSARFWLDWGIVEEQLYVARVYRPDDRALLGARLQAINGVPCSELLERMSQWYSFDNVYGALLRLSETFSNPLLLGQILGMETAPQTLRLQIRKPDGAFQEIEVTAEERQSGKAIEPESTIEMPEMSSAKIGWRFLDVSRETAYLRADSMMHYREAFEISRLSGNTYHIKHNIAEAVGEEKRELLPENLDEYIARVPAATDLLRDLFAAMREARTANLIVDLRFCPGGNSIFSLILDYFLYGAEDIVTHFDDGYQIKRYSPHYFQCVNDSSDQEEYRQPLRNGGYDFSDEERWLKQKREGLSAEEKQSIRQVLEGYYKMVPSFEQEYRSQQWEACWTPKILVLCAARTNSAGFTVLFELLQRSATIFGVPSSQAGNCFIDALPFTLEHSKLEGCISFKRSLLFPDEPERGTVLQPDHVLTYDYLAAHNFDPHATVTMALEHCAGG